MIDRDRAIRAVNSLFYATPAEDYPPSSRDIVDAILALDRPKQSSIMRLDEDVERIGSFVDVLAARVADLERWRKRNEMESDSGAQTVRRLSQPEPSKLAQVLARRHPVTYVHPTEHLGITAIARIPTGPNQTWVSGCGDTEEDAREVLAHNLDAEAERILAERES